MSTRPGLISSDKLWAGRRLSRNHERDAQGGNGDTVHLLDGELSSMMTVRSLDL